jgi:hypothetical protein
MTSAYGCKLITKVTKDPTVAEPLLQILHFFLNAKGDPLSEATARDVMLSVWTKTERCEDAMNEFISQIEIDQNQKAA